MIFRTVYTLELLVHFMLDIHLTRGHLNVLQWLFSLKFLKIKIPFSTYLSPKSFNYFTPLPCEFLTTVCSDFLCFKVYLSFGESVLLLILGVRQCGLIFL